MSEWSVIIIFSYILLISLTSGNEIKLKKSCKILALKNTIKVWLYVD